MPIVEKPLPPRRKADEIEEKPSKHQIKKEKRAERKKNKAHKYHKFQFIGPSPNPADGNLSENNSKMEKSDSESDADIEDNVEVNKNFKFDQNPICSRVKTIFLRT